jgi:hypothetical protein
MSGLDHSAQATALSVTVKAFKKRDRNTDTIADFHPAGSLLNVVRGDVSLEGTRRQPISREVQKSKLTPEYYQWNAALSTKMYYHFAYLRKRTTGPAQLAQEVLRVTKG